jgi:DNA (cytosine-5)-methyltransferase 1
LAADIDKNARKVYKNNYNLTPVDDIRTIDEKKIQNFDVLCAGFPCQPFSNGGNKKCFDDNRGLLFDEIIRIAKYKKPKFMFLENVMKSILEADDGYSHSIVHYIYKVQFL